VPKEKKPKTPNQLARAVSCFNLKWNQDGLKSWMNILALNCGCEIPLVDNVLVPHEIVYILYNIYIMYVKTYIIIYIL
jgi:hypothetical protein